MQPKSLLALLLLGSSSAAQSLDVSGAVQSWCTLRGSTASFGTPTPGTRGVPRLTTTGAPVVGLPFHFRVENALPGALGGLVFGDAPLFQPWAPFGAKSVVGLPLGTAVFVVGPDGTSPPLLASNPLAPALCGTTIEAVGLIRDPAARAGIAFTRSMAVTVGRSSGNPLLPMVLLEAQGLSAMLVREDFDGDGLADLAVGNTTRDVAVFLGEPRARFRLADFVDVSDVPRAMATGDLNLDGIPDLVTGDNRGVKYLLGQGDGTFVRRAGLTGANIYWTDMADLDGDGLEDLVAVDATNGPYVFLQQNNGTLLFNGFFVIGSFAPWAQLADFDGDNVLDLAAVLPNLDQVAIQKGAGDGTFGVPTAFAVDPDPQFLATGRLNDDAFVDLAVLHEDDDSVSLWFGDGDGTFTPAGSLAAGLLPKHVLLVDLNGDAIDDVVIADHGDLGTVGTPEGGENWIYLSTGPGSYGSPTTVPTGDLPQFNLAADWNGDGTLDLTVANSGGHPYSPTDGDVGIVLGLGGGADYVVPLEAPVGTLPSHLVTSDLNQDGIVDLILRDDSFQVRSLLGGGDGTFATGGLTPTRFATSIDVGDLDGDGVTDLGVSRNSLEQDVEVFRGQGDGQFVQQGLVPTDVNPEDLVFADLDGDGVLDLSVACRGTVSQSAEVRSYMGAGDGTFTPTGSDLVGSFTELVDAADLNGDGDLDLVVTTTSLLYWLEGNGDGTFGPAVNLPSVDDPRSLRIADLELDGDQDVVVASLFDDAVAVHLGLGDGSFEPVDVYGFADSLIDAEVGDLNRDGLPDLLVAEYAGQTLQLLTGVGDGTFAASDSFTLANQSVSIAVEDYDGDGLDDVALCSQVLDSVQVYLNQLLR